MNADLFAQNEPPALLGQRKINAAPQLVMLV
jgi:hypothetical protein